jgi:hypothetical protein
VIAERIYALLRVRVSVAAHATARARNGLGRWTALPSSRCRPSRAPRPAPGLGAGRRRATAAWLRVQELVDVADPVPD